MSQASGGQLQNIDYPSGRTFLNALFAAIMSGHAGATRPSYLPQYGCWLDTDTNILYLYDGSDDIPLFRYDATSNLAAWSNLALHDAGTTGGTANAQTATMVPALLAYATGQFFTVKAGLSNTGAMTLNINSVGAKTVKHEGGADLAAGEWLIGDNYNLRYDGTNLVLLNGRRVVLTKFTASGTWTPQTGMRHAIIECIGGGGGGGGVANSSAGSQSCAGGGGAGGYSRKRVTAADVGASQAVTVGAAAAGGAAGANNGANGNDTSVGALCIGKGGTGGTGAIANNASFGGAGGVAGTGDVTLQGHGGAPGTQGSIVTVRLTAGAGGDAGLGFGMGGAPTFTDTAGAAGQNYGGGGSGGNSFNAQGAQAGGGGAQGLIVITEHC